MKSVFAVGTMLITTTALASNPVALDKGAYAVSFIESAKVVSAELFFPACPPEAMCEPATKVTVKLPLNGCLDQLGPVSHELKYNENTAKYQLNIAAVNVHTKGSLVSYCVKMPEETFSFYTRPFLSIDDLEVNMMR